MNFTNEEIMDFLKDNDIKPSNIRLKVFRYLLNYRIHPTVDDIYNSLIDEIPTLSRTSIYNTMNLFKEKGIVNELFLNEKEIRYDINTKLHAHFKCEKCGIIYDFPIVENSNNGLKGFVIKNKSINYYGICAKCNK